jgi:hypothetical protein
MTTCRSGEESLKPENLAGLPELPCPETETHDIDRNTADKSEIQLTR